MLPRLRAPLARVSSLGLLVATLTAVGCGRGPQDESRAPAALEKQARALTGLENIVTIDFAGYRGQICIVQRGCATQSTQTIAVEDGTHHISIEGTGDANGGSAGTITVSGQGTAVALDDEAKRYFLPPVSTGTRATTLTPMTVAVRLDRAGFTGHIDFYLAGGFVGSEARLIPSRRYQLYTAFSGNITADDWLLEFDVDAAGRVSVPNESDRPIIRAGEGELASTLILQTVPVTLVRNGWQESVAFYASSDYFGSGPSSTVYLLKGRRYDFYAPWSSPTIRFSASGWDFTVASDGTPSLNPDTDGRIFRLLPGGVLEALPIPIDIDMGGYAGNSVIVGGPNLGPFVTRAQLLRGRSYDIRLWFTQQLDSNSEETSDLPDFTVRPEGVLTVDGEAQNTFEVAGSDQRTLRAKVMTVFYEPNGYPEGPSFYGSLGLRAGGAVALRGRRYRMATQSSHPFNGEAALFGSGVQFFSAGPDVRISPEGVISLEGGAAASFFAPNGGPVIHAQVSRLLVDAGGYTGSVCILAWPEHVCGAAGAGMDQVVLRNRRYIVHPAGAPVDVDFAGACAGGPLTPTTLTASCFSGGGPPEPPAALSARITSPTRVDLRWVDTSINESRFSVERRIEGQALWSLVTTCPGTANVTSCYDDAGLARGARYEYRVTAHNAAGTGVSQSLIVPFDLPEKPEGLVGDVSGTSSVTLQWVDRSTTETGFDIERSTDAIAFTRIATTAADARVFTDTMATEAGYYYRVRAVNAIDVSLPSNVVQIQLGVPGPPSVAQARLVDWFGSSGHVHVTWTDNSAGETGFSVERRDGTGAFREVGVTGRDMGGPQGGLVDLVGPGTFTYRVRALSAGEPSAYSNEVTLTVAPVTKPTLTATLVSGARIDLSWTALTHATSATLYRSEGLDSGIRHSPAASDTSFSDTAVEPGKTYTYVIEGKNLLGPALSDPVVVVVAVPPAPLFTYATVPTQTSVVLNWSYTPSTETGFRIVRTLGTQTATLEIPDRAARSHIDGAVAAGQSPTYQVRAYNLIGDSGPSPSTPIAVPMAKPTPAAAASAQVVGESQVELRWTDMSTNENGFVIRRRIPPTGAWGDLTTTLPNATRHVDISAASGAAYEYQVVATNAFGDADPAPAAITLVKPLSPPALTATLGGPNRVDLGWTDVSYETKYVITRVVTGQTAAATWDVAAGSSSFSDGSVLSDLTYTYQIVAVNGMGSSSPPATVTIAIARPVAPLTLTATLQSETQVGLEWTVSPTSTHTSFRLTRKLATQPDTAYEDVALPDAAARSFTSSVAASTDYVYKLVAVNGAGDSDGKLLELSTKKLVAPTKLLAKVTSSSVVTLSWVDNANNELGYRVHRSSNGTNWLPNQVYPPTSSPPLPANTSSYVMSSLASGATYHFRVVAVAGVATLNSDPSNVDRTQMVAPTPVPSNLVATAVSMTQVRLTWTDNIISENGFEIQHRPNASTAWSKLAETDRNVATFDHLNLVAGSPHQYQVRAFNGIATQSTFSNIATVSTPASCVGRPDGSPCDDANLCTTGETCQAGVCGSGTAKSCGTATACSTFLCEPLTGQCKPAHKPLGTTCNDSNLCTSGDVCNGAGTCGGVAKTCSDGNACTTDTCEAATGTCRNTASTCAVTPLAACTMKDVAGGTMAVFGYVSGAAENVEMIYGPDNQLTPTEYQGRQPRWFKPGTQQPAFALPVPATGALTWKLGSQTVSATAGTAPCSQVVTDKANEELFVDPSTILASSIVPPETVGASVTLHSLAGEVDVGSAGILSYSIPLDTPAGRRGIQPSLTLDYSSDGRTNGNLGVGWRLGGLGSIHRCQRTIAQDGESRPIRFSDEVGVPDGDAICLDGERLVLTVTNATETEYRTENESYVRVIKRTGTVGSQLFTYFEAYATDGRILTFGYPAGDGVRARQAVFDVKNALPNHEKPSYREVEFDWPLTSTRDRFRNRMDVEYSASPGTVDNGYAFSRLLRSITYTHHTSDSGVERPGLRTVRFTSEPRGSLAPNDPTAAKFVAGVKVEVPPLLTKIDIFAPPNILRSPASVPFRSYRLGYLTGHSNRPMLSSLTECVGTYCRPATTLAYTSSQVEFEEKDAGVGLSDLARDGSSFANYRWSDLAGVTAADIDGDGRDDLAYLLARDIDQKLVYHPSTGAGFGSGVVVSIPEGARTAGRPVFTDIDGDGRAEVGFHRVMFDSANQDGRWFLDFCRISNNQCIRINNDAPQPEQEYPGIGEALTIPLDTNGDGLPELLRTWKQAVQPTVENPAPPPQLFLEMRRNEGGVLGSYGLRFTDDLRPAGKRSGGPAHGYLNVLTALDLDGDGAQEILYPASENDYTLSARSVRLAGIEAARMTNIRRPWPNENWFADLNGDGLRDLLYLSLCTYQGAPLGRQCLTQQLNTGVGFLPPEQAPWVSDDQAPSRTWMLDRDDDNFRVVDLDRDGAEELLLVDNTINGSRPKLSFVGYREGGLLRWKELPINVGAYANGPAGSYENQCDIVGGSRSALVEQLISCMNLGGTRTNDTDPYGHHLSQVLDINGDGLTDILTYNATTNRLMVNIRKGPAPERLRGVSTGFGRGSFEVVYATLHDRHPGQTERPLYQPEPSCAAPFICERGGRWVVAEVKRDDGKAGRLRTIYSYKDGRSLRNGRGFLGFGERWEDTSRQDPIGLITTTTHVVYRSFEEHRTVFQPPRGIGPTINRSFYPLQGIPKSTETIVSREGAERIRHRTQSVLHYTASCTAAQCSTWDGGTDVLTEDHDLNAGAVGLVSSVVETRTQSPRGYGRVEEVRREIYSSRLIDGQRTLYHQGTELVKNEDFLPDNDAARLIGPPTRIKSTSYAAAVPSEHSLRTRTVTYAYDPATLFMTGMVREPEGAANERLDTTLTPSADGTGMLAKATVSGGGETRTTRYSYDTLESTYLQSSTDDLGLTTTTLYHPALDAPVAVRDPNGITTKHIYDAFGRLQKRDMPPGVADVTISHHDFPRRVQTSVSGGPTSTRYLDYVGRSTIVDTTYPGGISRVRSEYDVLGRKVRASSPYHKDPQTENESPVYTSVTYDELGRVLTVTGPQDDGTTVAVERNFYFGTYRRSLDANGAETESEVDAAGNIIRASQTLVNPDTTRKKVTAAYQYGPFDVLHAVEVSPDLTAQAVMTMSFGHDRLGRRTSSNDPNRGSSSITYTAFDEVFTATDAADGTVTYHYDAIGRRRERVAPEGTSTWRYDSALNGLGRLHSMTSPEGVSDEVTYDSLGRLKTSRRSLSGQTFEFDRHYDSTFGRLERLSYPVTPGWPRFEVAHHYRATGELERVTRVDSGADLWKANAVNAWGLVTNETLGQLIGTETIYGPVTGRMTNANSDLLTTGESLDRLSYEYYENGNVKIRRDARDAQNPFTEHFAYDSLNRLESWQSASAEGTPRPEVWKVKFTYDEIGNLLSRATSGSAGSAQTAIFAHGGTANAGPTAVTGWNITGGSMPGRDMPSAIHGACPDENGGPACLGYDTGRRLRFHPRLGKVDYNSFDLPTVIDGPRMTTRFGYDGGGTRAYKHEDQRNGRVSMTIYAGLYELRTKIGADGGDTVEHVLHVKGGTGGVGQITRKTVNGQLSEVASYFTRDHLGSVRTVASTDGQKERRITDPFGNKVQDPRFPVLDVAPLVMSTPSPAVTSGFTGHEQDDALGLINMRGRIYEPISARFLSPDPIVGYDPQSWNAYAYVRNRPMNFVDPSGFNPIRHGGLKPPPAPQIQCTSEICHMANACMRGENSGCRAIGELSEALYRESEAKKAADKAEEVKEDPAAAASEFVNDPEKLAELKASGQAVETAANLEKGEDWVAMGTNEDQSVWWGVTKEGVLAVITADSHFKIDLAGAGYMLGSEASAWDSFWWGMGSHAEGEWNIEAACGSNRACQAGFGMSIAIENAGKGGRFPTGKLTATGGKTATTRPTLPTKTIAAGGGVRVEHYYKSGDHGPAHAHVKGGGPETRIGPNGKPLKGDPELTGPQRELVEENIGIIRRAINKIGRFLSSEE